MLECINETYGSRVALKVLSKAHRLVLPIDIIDTENVHISDKASGILMLNLNMEI